MIPLTRSLVVKTKSLGSKYLCFIHRHSAGRLETNLIGMGMVLIKQDISMGRTLFSLVYFTTLLASPGIYSVRW